MKPNVLFLLHFSPAIHGSAVVGKAIRESTFISKAFEARYVNLLLSSKVAESGQLSLQKLAKVFNNWFTVLKMLVKKKPDICYFALSNGGAAFFKDVVLVGILKIFGVKMVYHLHNKGFIKKQHSYFFRLLFDFVFSGSEVIILSRRLYSDIAPFVPENRVHICPNGVPAVHSEMKTSAKAVPQILFLSNLIESKGVKILLQACALLKERDCPFQCTFVGGEGDISAEQLNEMISTLGLAGQVSYLGRRYGDEKERIYREADIFAFPTYYEAETFGLVNVEAMQYRLPVVSTFEGGIPDVVGDGVTGFVVPQKDVTALADKLELLARDEKLRQQMGEAGYQKYLNEFTLEKFEHRIVEIMQQVVSEVNAKQTSAISKNRRVFQVKA